MNDAACFKATYSDFRLIKGRKVVQFVFELPLEQADSALKAVGGMPNPAAEVWCAIARLNPERQSELKEPRADDLGSQPASGPDIQARARKVDPDKRLAQRAGILCGDSLFHKYLAAKHGVEMHAHADRIRVELAAEFVRQFCKVETRAYIKFGEESGTRFDLLESSFVCWRDVPEIADAS